MLRARLCLSPSLVAFGKSSNRSHTFTFSLAAGGKLEPMVEALPLPEDNMHNGLRQEEWFEVSAWGEVVLYGGIEKSATGKLSVKRPELAAYRRDGVTFHFTWGGPEKGWTWHSVELPDV